MKHLSKLTIILPGQCGSGGASSYKLKGHGFDCQLGYMLGLQIWSPVGVHMRDNQPMFLSHMFLSLPLSLTSSLSKISKHVSCDDFFLKKENLLSSAVV